MKGMRFIESFFNNLKGTTIVINPFWGIVLLLSCILLFVGGFYPNLAFFGVIGFKLFLIYFLYRIFSVGLGFEKKQDDNRLS